MVVGSGKIGSLEVENLMTERFKIGESLRKPKRSALNIFRAARDSHLPEGVVINGVSDLEGWNVEENIDKFMVVITRTPGTTEAIRCFRRGAKKYVHMDENVERLRAALDGEVVPTIRRQG